MKKMMRNVWLKRNIVKQEKKEFSGQQKNIIIFCNYFQSIRRGKVI